MITVRGGPLAACNGDLFSEHLVEQRATDLECPDIVERLQATLPVKYPDLFLVQHSGVRVSRWRNLVTVTSRGCTELVRVQVSASNHRCDRESMAECKKSEVL